MPIIRHKKRPLKKRVVIKRVVIKKPKSRRQGVLSEIVINLKTPMRTPGGRILKSVSDQISRSPGTQQDHEITRLIVSAVPVGKQALVEKRLETIQESPGLWARFKAMVSKHEDIIGPIAGLIVSYSATVLLRRVFPQFFPFMGTIMRQSRDMDPRRQNGVTSPLTPYVITPNKTRAYVYE